MFDAESIGQLVKAAGGCADLFAPQLNAIAEHERLVALQSAEPPVELEHAEPPANESAGDHAGS